MRDFEPISEHIFRLELPWRPFGLVTVPVATWLVRDREGWTLVDAGPPETSDQVISAVARTTNGRGPQRVLLTHAHYDHGGGLEALRTAWNPAILCHRDEVPFVTGQMSYAQIKPQGAAFWLGRFMMRRAPWELPVARDLERGQSAVGMAVIHLPGHTPGHIGFLHPTDHAMICGDAVMHFRGRISPPLSLATPDPKVARASMVRLSELDFLHLLPSHGPPILDHGRQAVLDFLTQKDLGPEIGDW